MLQQARAILATLVQIFNMQGQILERFTLMSAKGDEIKAKLKEVGDNVSAIADDVSEVAGDVQELKDQIAGIAGDLPTAEEWQAITDSAGALATKTAAVKDAARKAADMVPEPPPPTTQPAV